MTGLGVPEDRTGPMRCRPGFFVVREGKKFV